MWIKAKLGLQEGAGGPFQAQEAVVKLSGSQWMCQAGVQRPGTDARSVIVTGRKPLHVPAPAGLCTGALLSREASKHPNLSYDLPVHDFSVPDLPSWVRAPVANTEQLMEAAHSTTHSSFLVHLLQLWGKKGTGPSPHFHPSLALATGQAQLETSRGILSKFASPDYYN